MRRWFIFFLFLFLIVAGFTLGATWLFNTTEGVRCLMGAISRVTSLQIDAENVAGQLGKELRMEKVHIRWPQGEMEVNYLQLRWQPLSLLLRRLAVNDLILQGLQIRDHRPESKTSTDLTWPKIPGSLFWVHGEIRNLNVRNFSYRRGNHDPFKADRFVAKLKWNHGILVMEKMNLEIPSGIVKGSLEFGLLRPGLTLDLHISPSVPLLGLDRFGLRTRLLPARGPEQVAGNVSIEGASRSIKQLTIESEIGIAPEALALRKFLLSRPGRQGTLTGEGRVAFTEDDPLMNLKMNFSDLDITRESGLRTALSGTLQVEGNPNDYRGNINIENAKGEWYSGNLSGHFRGSLKGLRWTLLDGSILDGNVRGHLNAEWEEGLSLNGAIQATNLNPEGIAPAWDGKINLNLEGSFRLPKGKSPEGRLKAHFPESYLRGHQLTGDIDLHLEKSLLRLVRANLRGKGFDLQATGAIPERVDFKAEISDLSGLVPGVRGTLLSRGWFRWRNGLVALSVDSQGKGLFIKGTELGRLDLSARFDGGEDARIELKGNLRKAAYQSLRIDSASLDAVGHLTRHKILFSVRLPEGERIDGSLEGGYVKESWQGRIVQLTGRDQRGSLRMEAPASLHLSSHQVALKSFSVTSSQGERVGLSVDLSLRPLRGRVQSEWRRFDLARINPWLGHRRLEALATGDLNIQWLEEDRMTMAGAMDLTGTYADPSLTVGFSKGRVQFDWNEKRLKAMGDFELETGGKFRADLSSPQPARMAFPKPVHLEARWEAVDLSFFRPWLPQTVDLNGRLSGRLSGQWLHGPRFDHAGEVRVSEGTLRWRNGQGQIETDLQTLDLHWRWRDETLRGRFSLDLNKLGNLKGSFDLPVAPQLPVVFQRKGPLQFSLRGQVRETGLLTAFFPDFLQESRGQAELDLSAEGTWEHPRMKGLLKLKKVEVHLPAGKVRPQTAKDNLSGAPLKLELPQGLLKFNWDEKELIGTGDFDFADQGKIQATMSSPQSGRMAFPEQGKVEVKWQAIDVRLFKPWFPDQLVLEGQWVGRLSGQWSAKRFDATGEMKMMKGAVGWQHEEGLLRASVQTADVTWAWRDEWLRGDLSLALAEYGHIKGHFQLPIFARLPVAARSAGPIRLSLQGQFREKGLLPAFLPGMVQESQGQVYVNLTAGGTWQAPRFEGGLKLEKAGGYLPTAGIRLKDLDLEAQWMGDQVQITSFRTRSGPGHLEGTATVWLENWKVLRYQGTLKGDRFQTIYFPELQVLSAPHLQFEGSMRKLSVRGEIRLPEVSIFTPQGGETIRPSPDVIVMDRPEVPKKGLPVAIDIQVRFLLGEKAFVKAEGIEARLVGTVGLNIQDPGQVNAEGEIRVAEGHYNIYGQKLEITRGRLIFARGPVDNPALDAVAVRKIREVQAGVLVAGTLKSPMVRLYSRPSMADTDVLSYIILGQPLGTGKEQAPSLMQAAAGLLSAGESVVLQGRLKKLFGLDVLDIQTGGDDLSRSMVTVGKYLTPKLYISLGRSLFTEATLVTLRYSLSKRLEIETHAGTESGASIYYRIEFR